MLLRKTDLRMALISSPPEKQYNGMLWAAKGSRLFLNNNPGCSFSYFPKFRSVALCNTVAPNAMTKPYLSSAGLFEIRFTGGKNDNR